MSTLNRTLQSAKSAYGTPTLIAYGKLAERTKAFGLLNPEDLAPNETGSTTNVTI